jgi:glycosyltransferase involved in cell wall biosynthesis
MKKKEIFFFTKYGSLSASTRERFNNFIPFLNEANIAIKSTSLITNKILKTKIFKKKVTYKLFFLILSRVYKILFIKKKLLIIQYELITYFPSILEFYLKLRKIPFIIDLDDIVYLKYRENLFLRFFFRNKYKNIFSWASAIIVGNKFLQRDVKKLSKTHVYYIPTMTNLNVKKYPKYKSFTVIWIGSPSTTKYVDDLKYVIEYLSIHEDVKFRIIGSHNSKIEINKNIRHLKWTKRKENEYISSSHLGIMPLRNGVWEKGKCGYKLIQYMSCSLPVIASPVGSNLDIVKKNKSGFFANNEQEWIDLILKYKKNSNLRNKHGNFGREFLNQNFNIEKLSKTYIQLINKHFI